MSSTTTAAAAPGYLPPAAAPEAPPPARVPFVPYVRRRDSIGRILHDLWDARYLLYQFVRRDITVRYAQAVMGFAWALLMPALVVGAGLLFRAAAGGATGTSGALSGIGSLLVKSVPWAFFSSAISIATASVFAQSALLSKVKFPREALPVAAVAAQGFDFAISVVFVAIALPFFGATLSWALLWAPVLIALLVMFTLGASLLLSCANLFYRDVKYIVQVILQFGVFATPVFFAPEVLPARFRDVMLALPLTPYIQGLDLAITRGHNLLRPLALASPKTGVLATVWQPWMLAYAAVLPAVTLYVGLRIFRRASGRFAEIA